MPYLLPLLLQLAMGFSPAEAGMMLLPVTLAPYGVLWMEILAPESGAHA